MQYKNGKFTINSGALGDANIISMDTCKYITKRQLQDDSYLYEKNNLNSRYDRIGLFTVKN